MNITSSDQIIRELLGALNTCTEQINQMDGMFDDEDGAIAAALEHADRAEAVANEWLRRPAG